MLFKVIREPDMRAVRIVMGEVIRNYKGGPVIVTIELVSDSEIDAAVDKLHSQLEKCRAQAKRQLEKAKQKPVRA